MRPRIALITLALAAAGCSSTGSGGHGDPRAEPAADKYGTGSRLHELIGEATWYDASNMEGVGCAYPPDREVFATGLTITAVDDFDETGGGARGNLYVQDSLDGSTGPLPYSGITVFEPGFSPPDLRVVPGDVMDILGLLTEFGGLSSFTFSYCRSLPEISGAMERRFEGGHIDPIVVEAADFADYQKARRWLGMLVTVKGMKLADDPYKDSAGRYSVRFDVGGGVAETDLPQITNELFDLEQEGPALAKDETLASVTGVVTFFFSFHIAPRDAADVIK